MDTQYTLQPLETQTLYAELMERLTIQEAHRSIGHLAGCFVTKKIKGETYYYFQYSDPGGKLKQKYIGKKSPELDELQQQFKKEKALTKNDEAAILRLCAQLRAGEALVTDSTSARVIQAFANGGFFTLSGVLVGTHAFTVLGNMLGVRWKQASLKTQDVDLASHAIMRVAVPTMNADIPKILDDLKMGFLPVPSLNIKEPSTSFKVRGKALRVDILTPSKKRTPTKAVVIPRFNTAAQALPYLDYLIENPQQAAVISGNGILVNVPAPARFAFHKLILAGERSSSFQTKAAKDIQQAEQILSFLSTERAGDILLAWEALTTRSDGSLGRARRALARLKQKNPELKASLSKIS